MTKYRKLCTIFLHQVLSITDTVIYNHFNVSFSLKMFNSLPFFYYNKNNNYFVFVSFLSKLNTTLVRLRQSATNKTQAYVRLNCHWSVRSSVCRTPVALLKRCKLRSQNFYLGLSQNASCLSNAVHSIGQSIKSPECPCVRACVQLFLSRLPSTCPSPFPLCSYEHYLVFENTGWRKSSWTKESKRGTPLTNTRWL